MSKMMYKLWMVDFDDSWHEMNMKWLVIKVTWYWYETQFYIHGLRRMNGYGFQEWIWLRIWL